MMVVYDVYARVSSADRVESQVRRIRALIQVVAKSAH